MKFDYIIGNPPYLRGLHIKISNRMTAKLQPLGEFIFIQPAAMYFNKNKKPSYDELLYKNTIQNFKTEATEMSGNVFSAEFATSLIVTKITNTPEQNIKMTYRNNKTYFLPLDLITYTNINPAVFKNIKKKLEVFLEKGNIKHLISKRGTKGTGAVISTIRGNIDQETGKLMSNFWSIYSPINYKKGYITSIDETTIRCEKHQTENVYDYLTKKVPLMCQALYKYSIQTWNYNMIPLVDFNRTYTNEELYAEVGLTPDEIEIIEQVIGDYDPRTSKLKIMENK